MNKTITKISLCVLLFILFLCIPQTRTQAQESTCSHEFSEITLNPTCQHIGYRVQVCMKCGFEVVMDMSEMIDHPFSVQTQKGDCTHDSTITYSCPYCSSTHTEVLEEAQGHTFVYTTTPETCTDAGYTKGVCSVCSHEEYTEYTQPKGHHYEWEVVEPTCTTCGYSILSCPDCGDRYYTNLQSAKGHHFVVSTVQPSKTTLGYTLYTCTDCSFCYMTNYLNTGELRYVVGDDEGDEEEIPETTHTHEYHYSVVLNSVSGNFFIQKGCSCGDTVCFNYYLLYDTTNAQTTLPSNESGTYDYPTQPGTLYVIDSSTKRVLLEYPWTEPLQTMEGEYEGDQPIDQTQKTSRLNIYLLIGLGSFLSLVLLLILIFYRKRRGGGEHKELLNENTPEEEFLPEDD